MDVVRYNVIKHWTTEWLTSRRPKNNNYKSRNDILMKMKLGNTGPVPSCPIHAISITIKLLQSLLPCWLHQSQTRNILSACVSSQTSTILCAHQVLVFIAKLLWFIIINSGPPPCESLVLECHTRSPRITDTKVNGLCFLQTTFIIFMCNIPS